MTPRCGAITSGEISSSVAMRISTSARMLVGQLRRAAARRWPAFRCARISAIVCGCSPRMNFESCCGLARLERWRTPAVELNDLTTRSRMRRDMSGAERLDQQPARVLDAAGGDVLGGAPTSCGTRRAPARRSRARSAPSERDLARDLLDLVLAEVLEQRRRGALRRAPSARRWRPCGRRDGAVTKPSTLMRSSSASQPRTRRAALLGLVSLAAWRRAASGPAVLRCDS